MCHIHEACEGLVAKYRDLGPMCHTHEACEGLVAKYRKYGTVL